MTNKILVAAALLLVLGGTASAQTASDLFNGEVLQRIDLWMNASDWAKLKANFKENEYYPVDVTWNGVNVTNAGVRSRGNGSRLSSKPGLRVDFDHYSNGQTFVGLKSFVLDNLSQDSSGVHETTTVRVFARMGIPASREAHCKLYVRGEYAGIYAVVEEVDKDLLKRVFGEINGDTQNDGYLFEYKYNNGPPWKSEYLGSALDPYKAYFDAKTHESKGDSTIWGPIEELWRLINNTPSSSFAETINPKLDLTEFVKYIAIQAYLAENDGFVGYAGQNNFYFYRLENSPQHVFIAWDDDNTFFSTDFPINARIDENVLARKTLELPQYKTLFYQTQIDLAAMMTDGNWLKNEIDRQLALIAEPMASDTAKPYSTSEHVAASTFMSDFPATRSPFVQCEAAKQLGTTKPAGCQ